MALSIIHNSAGTSTSFKLGLDTVLTFDIAGTTLPGNATLPLHAVPLQQVLGGNQVWQNVLSGRAHSTLYTNSTGRPIMVSITCGLAYSIVSLAVNGTIVAQTVQNWSSTLSAIVPSGASYSISNASTLSYWAELR